MKPDLKICGNCSGDIVIERYPDYVQFDGAVVSSAALIKCERKEVPRECPMILEHTIVQDKP